MMMVEAVTIPGWHDWRIPAGGVVVLVFVLGWHYLDRWATDRKERFRQAEIARRRQAGRARGQEMARTGQHRAVQAGTRPPVSGPAPSLLGADQAALLATIRGLRREIADLNRELLIRPEPDPILRALLAGPLSLSQIAATIGVDFDETERRCLRLVHITEQVERIRPDGRGDWKFTLKGSTGSARPGILPARGKAG